ncbi:MAG: elongation factor G, partial [Saprospiraceae bacterium]|nr:elongation factor G [Saprospiraceae bacterium]
EEEDPTFQVYFDAETNQTIVRGMGELHLEILLDRLLREFKVAVNRGIPQVNYKEALTQTVRHRERLERTVGPTHLFAEMEFEIGPADPEFLLSEAYKSGKTKLQFEWAVPAKAIDPKNEALVAAAFASMMHGGVLAGNSLDSMKVRVLDGLMLPSASRPPAFELCAKYGFRAAAPKCEPVLLEPVMRLEVTTPAEFLGAVLADLGRRRGVVLGQAPRLGDAVAVQAEAPLAAMVGYVTALRTLSSGRANSTMEFSHYAQV